MSENGDIEDVTETAYETGDDLGHDNSENGNQGEIKDFEKTTTGDYKNVAQIFLKYKFPCYYCNGSNVYQTAVVRCPICFWYDGYKICPVCEHDIPVRERKHSKDGFNRYPDCHAVRHIDPKTRNKLSS